MTFLNGNTGSPLTNQSTIFYAADTALTMMIFQMGPGDAFGCHLTSTDTTYFAAYNSGNSSWHAWTLPSPFVRTNFANVSTGLNGEYAFAMASIGSRVIGINATADGFAGFTVAYPQFTDATLSVTTFTPSDPYNPAGFGLPVGLSGSVGAINGVAIGGDDLIFAYRRGNEVFIAERDNVISNFTAYRDATAEFTATINGVPQVLLPRSFSRDGRIALAEAGFNVFEFTRLSRHSATPSGFTPFQPRKNPATTAADGIGGFRTVLRGACQGSSAPLVGTCVGGCAGERICFYQ
ncbi:MAG: hypothetical protein IT381_04675 [Deltaproteobacteria bacterium]|nr:hypothetical protein [Deltaproteobacteria bacterium]